jgi:hypothetical protein
MVMDLCNAENEDDLVNRVDNVLTAITMISAVSVDDSKTVLMSVITTLVIDLKRSGACIPVGVTMVVKDGDNNVDKN